MAWMYAHWAPLCEVIGVALEVLGILLMANVYTHLLLRQMPLVLVSALWRGKPAHDAAGVAELFKERAVVSLQGLAVMCLGFLFKAIPSIVHLVH